MQITLNITDTAQIDTVFTLILERQMKTYFENDISTNILIYGIDGDKTFNKDIIVTDYFEDLNRDPLIWYDTNKTEFEIDFDQSFNFATDQENINGEETLYAFDGVR